MPPKGRGGRCLRLSCALAAGKANNLAAYEVARGAIAAMANNGLQPSRDQITGFCRRHHIRKLSLFGSVLREDFGPDSDIDVLVEFEAGHVPGFFRLFDLEKDLSELFGGRKIDLRTPRDLSRYFRDEVVAAAKAQYASE